MRLRAVFLSILLGCLFLSGCGKPKPAPKPPSVYITDVSGWSMLGAYTKKGIITKNKNSYQALIDPTIPFSDVKVGDIIVYRDRFRGGKNIIHKVIERRGKAVRCQGTGNVVADNLWITEIDYMGTATGIKDTNDPVFHPIR